MFLPFNKASISRLFSNVAILKAAQYKAKVLQYNETITFFITIMGKFITNFREIKEICLKRLILAAKGKKMISMADRLKHRSFAVFTPSPLLKGPYF